jgi:hypothetical protein
VSYDEGQSLRDARASYFHSNGFPDDGGYTSRWVKFQMGPLRFRIPNTPSRVRAVRFHDLHHVATDYATDWTGEAEIGAWEIASSCAGHVAAWILNLYAMAIGLWIAPRAVWRAFLRGRRTRNLYRDEWSEALLETKVGTLRARLGLDRVALDPGTGTLAEGVAFAGWAATALSLQLATAALFLAPIGLAIGYLQGLA